MRSSFFMRRSSLSVASYSLPARRFRIAARLVDWIVVSESTRQGGLSSENAPADGTVAAAEAGDFGTSRRQLAGQAIPTTRGGGRGMVAAGTSRPTRVPVPMRRRSWNKCGRGALVRMDIGEAIAGANRRHFWELADAART
jgi:hypothetical protein